MIYRFANFQVDATEFRLYRDGAPVVVEPKALRLLLYLVRNPGRLVGKQELLDNVWPDASVGDNALTRGMVVLRKALADSSRTPRFIETVPREGYRFVAEVRTEAGVLMAAGEPSSDGADAAILRRRSASWYLAIGLTAVIVVGVAAVAVRRFETHSHASMRVHSIAVLPLENLSGNAAEEYFADGATDELTTELARVQNLRVVSKTSAMQEKGSRKTLRQIAEELHADAVVEGSVALSGDRVRINAQLVDVSGDSHLWSSSVEGSVSELVSLEDRVAEEIAVHARLVWTPPSGDHAGTALPAAHDAYLRGLYFFDRRDPMKSAAYFQQAVELDPNYASAYAGLSGSLVSEAVSRNFAANDVIGPARAAAQRAIELDPRNGDAYIALGYLEQTLSWDWKAAERDLLQGMSLNPSNSDGPIMYALRRQAAGDNQTALAFIQRARDNDPLSFYVERQYSNVLYYARRYDDALRELQRTQEMFPDSSRVTNKWMSWIYEQKGMRDEAVAHDLLSIQEEYAQPDLDAMAAQYRAGGWKAYWRARLKRLHPENATGCNLYYVGTVYLRAGERDKAMVDLDGATTQHCFWMSEASVDPMLDELRGDPRFEDLLRRLDLPSGTLGKRAATLQ